MHPCKGIELYAFDNISWENRNALFLEMQKNIVPTLCDNVFFSDKSHFIFCESSNTGQGKIN